MELRRPPAAVAIAALVIAVAACGGARSTETTDVSGATTGIESRAATTSPPSSTRAPVASTSTTGAETTTSVSEAVSLSVECDQLAAEVARLRQERLDAVGTASVEQLDREEDALEGVEYGGEPRSDAWLEMDPDLLTRRLMMDGLWEEAARAGCMPEDDDEFERSFCGRVGHLASHGPAGAEILRDWLLSCALLLDDAARERLAALARSDGDTVVIDDSPSCTPFDIAVARDAVWMTDGVRAWLVDPAAHAVVGRSRSLGAFWVAAEGDEVWFSNIDGGYATHLDWEARSEDLIEVGADPTGVAMSDDAVWVAARPGVVRLDRTTHEIVARITLYASVSEVVFAGDAVWALEWSFGSVYRVDPATNRMAGDPVLLPRESYVDMVADGAGLWVADETGNVLRISFQDAAVVGTIATDAEVSSLAVGGGFVWAATRDGEILRIDPAAATVEPAFSLDGTLDAIGADDSRLWVLWYAEEGGCRVTSFEYDLG